MKKFGLIFYQINVATLICLVATLFFFYIIATKSSAIDSIDVLESEQSDSSGENSKSSDTIIIDNHIDGDVQSFPLALLCGRVPNILEGTLIVENLSSGTQERVVRTKVSKERFKILVPLIPGINRLNITTENFSRLYTLYYHKNINPYLIRLVAFVIDDSEKSSHTAEKYVSSNEINKSDQGDIFLLRYKTSALLWQTALAESLNDSGYGRRSFNLEIDQNNEVVIWKVLGEKKLDYYRSLSQEKFFQEVEHRVAQSFAFSPYDHYFVLIVYPEEQERYRVALGTTGIGMMDSTTTFCWPCSVSEVEEVFSDQSSISETFSYDSAYRNVSWALTSSSIGAGLHELGHALGLKHSDCSYDYMNRGFDFFNRIFTVYEPPSLITSGGDCSLLQPPLWGEKSARALLRSNWITE